MGVLYFEYFLLVALSANFTIFAQSLVCNGLHMIKLGALCECPLEYVIWYTFWRFPDVPLNSLAVHSPWIEEIKVQNSIKTCSPQPGRCSTLTIVMIIIIIITITIIILIIFIFMRGQNLPPPPINMLIGVIASNISPWGIKIRHPLWTISWPG